MIKTLLVSICVVGPALSLRLEDAEEGSCRSIRYQTLPKVDLEFVDSLNYMSAGNRYHFYRLASGHPRFREMRDFELYYKACLTQNTSYAIGDGSAFGFGGRVLGSFISRSRPEQPTIIDTTPFPSGGPYDPMKMDRMQQHITLTDHRTFVFFANCWVGADQRSWDVYSLTSELTPAAKRNIEEHAISLGFNREEVVFLNYNSCGGDPLPDENPSQGIGIGDHSGSPGKFVDGLGWSKKVTLASRNTYPLPPVIVPLPNIDSSIVAAGGKKALSRITINPVLGNNQLRRVNLVGAGTANRLSLASTGGTGWSR